MVFVRIAAVVCLVTGLGGSFAFAQVAGTPDPAKPPAVLTWVDCVKLATAHNPDLQASREAILNSDAVRMGAYSQLYPQITASFGNNRFYSGAYLNSPSNYGTSYSEQLSLSQTIFNGFATKGNIDAARAQLNLAFANMNAEKATISFDLKSAFAQLLYAQQLINISKDIITIQQKNARLVKLLYDGGSEDKGNMLLSQANLDQAIFELNQAVRLNEVSAIQLGTVVGELLPDNVRAVGTLQTVTLEPKPIFTKLAQQTPLYFQKRAQTDAAAAGITQANSGWYPTVTADAAVFRSGQTFPAPQNNWAAGFSVSYPLFQGGQTYFNVKAANASLREALASLRSGTDQAALTLAQTYKSMVDAEENVRIQQELLEAKALRYKIGDADYRNGLMSFQDFNTITDSYVSQQQALLSSQLNAVISEANWEQAKGLGAIP